MIFSNDRSLHFLSSVVSCTLWKFNSISAPHLSPEILRALVEDAEGYGGAEGRCGAGGLAIWESRSQCLCWHGNEATVVAGRCDNQCRVNGRGRGHGWTPKAWRHKVAVKKVWIKVKSGTLLIDYVMMGGWGGRGSSCIAWTHWCFSCQQAGRTNEVSLP